MSEAVAVPDASAWGHEHWRALAERCRRALADPVVERHVRLVLLDTVGAIVAGMREPELDALAARLRRPGGGDDLVVPDGAARFADEPAHGLPVPGTAGRFDPADALLLMGAAGTALEADEGNRHARGHPAIHIVPVVLATGAREDRHLSEILLALLLGYEVASELGAATDLRAVHHQHGTWGVAGAAAAAAQLDGADLGDAIALAASMPIAGQLATIFEGATVRNLYAGLAGAIGRWSADAAASGFTAHTRAVEIGFGEAVGGGALGDPPSQERTRPFILDNYLKPYPTCRWVHAAIGAFEALLVEHELTADEIERVEVTTYPLAAQLDDPHPANLLQARFSIPWALAVRATAGRLDWRTLDRGALADPSVHDLAARIHVAPDEQFAATRGARVAIAVHGGAISTLTVDETPGEGARALTEQQVIEKFIHLTEPSLGAATARSVVATTLGGDPLVAELVAAAGPQEVLA